MPDTASERVATGRHRLDAVLFSLLLVLLASVVAGFAWSRPTTVFGQLQYKQSGQLSYDAPAPATSLYGSAGLSTGEPMYASVLTQVRVTYAYHLSSASARAVAGTEQLVATISNGLGVTRTIPLQPRSAFRGDRFIATGTLSLAPLEQIGSTFDQAAGHVSTYDVTISPMVRVHGLLGSAVLHASFDPPTKFSLSTNMLAPKLRTGTGGLPSATGSAPSTSSGSRPFSSTATGAATPVVGQTATLLGAPVFMARIVSLAIMAIALAAAAVLGWPLLSAIRDDDERTRISLRLGSSLIEVSALPVGPSALVELTSFTGLAQVARKLECPVLHLCQASVETYAVVDNGTLYRYCFHASRPHGIGRMPASRTKAGRHAASVPDDANTTPSSATLSRGR